MLKEGGVNAVGVCYEVSSESRRSSEFGVRSFEFQGRHYGMGHTTL